MRMIPYLSKPRLCFDKLVSLIIKVLATRPREGRVVERSVRFAKSPIFGPDRDSEMASDGSPRIVRDSPK